MPASTVNADADLRRESAIGDLAIYGGAGKPGAGKYGLQADDAFWVGHGNSSILSWSVTPPLLEHNGNIFEVGNR